MRAVFLQPPEGENAMNEPIKTPAEDTAIAKGADRVVDAEGNAFTAQTVTFHSPGKEVRP
jgi:hypothetical protein